MNKVLFYGLVFVLLVSGVSAILPANNSVIYLNTTKYVMDYRLDYYNISFIANTSGVSLDCNNSKIQIANRVFFNTNIVAINYANISNCNINTTGGYLASSKGIEIGGTDNVVITNITISNTAVGIAIGGGTNKPVGVTIRNVLINRTYGNLAGIILYSCTGVLVDNVTSNNNLNESFLNHGLYISATNSSKTCDNIIIQNSNFSNNIGQGIHTNYDSTTNPGFINNLTITNSQFINNTAAGLDFNGVSNSTLSNSLIKNNPITALALGFGDYGNLTTSYNNIFINNNFTGSGQRDVRVSGSGVIAGGGINQFINNTWSSTIPSHANFRLENYVNRLNITGVFPKDFKMFFVGLNANFTLLNYSNFSVNVSSSTVSIYPVYPFDDLKNGAVSVVNDSSNYTFGFSSGQSWTLSDYYYPLVVNGCSVTLNDTPLKDDSGNGNTLTNSGASYNPTEQNYEFNSLQKTCLSTSYTNLNNQTISLMVKINPIQSNYAILGGVDGSILFQVVNTKLLFQANDGIWNSVSDNINLSQYNSSEWHLLTGVFIKNKNLTFYKDGVLIGTTNVSNNLTITIHKYVFGSGFSAYDVAHSFNGSIDNVMVFNRSLSADEVLALYEGRWVDPTGKVAEYTFTNNTLWQIPMANNCTINQNFNGTILLNGTGIVYLNSTLNTTNMWIPRANQTRFFLSNARLY